MVPNIEFRIWRKDEQKFIAISENLVGKRCAHRCMRTEAQSFTVFCLDDTENFIHHLYTGFKDGQGKKIFFGDIVSYGRFTGKICWDNGFFIGLKTNTDARFHYPRLSYRMALSLEVIGNICENPELLERCVYVP